VLSQVQLHCHVERSSAEERTEAALCFLSATVLQPAVETSSARRRIIEDYFNWPQSSNSPQPPPNIEAVIPRSGSRLSRRRGICFCLHQMAQLLGCAHLLFFGRDDLRKIGDGGKFAQQLREQRQAVAADVFLVGHDHHAVEEFIDLGPKLGNSL
jgi:hypothetical protein